jgi:hypothetical protein
MLLLHPIARHAGSIFPPIPGTSARKKKLEKQHAECLEDVEEECESDSPKPKRLSIRPGPIFSAANSASILNNATPADPASGSLVENKGFRGVKHSPCLGWNKNDLPL